MKVLNTNLMDLNDALMYCNEYYAGNITFKDCYKITKKNVGTYKVSLSVKDSHLRGSSKNAITGRRIHSACWHVHGMFIAKLLKSGARIRAMGKKINTSNDNWKDLPRRERGIDVHAWDRCNCND